MTEGTGIGPLQIVRRLVNPNRDDLSFSVEISPPTDTHDIAAFQSNVNAVLDVIGEVAAREQLKSDLAEKRRALKVAHENPATVRKDIERLRATRMAVIASHDATYAKTRQGALGRSREAGPKEKEALAQIDQQIAQAEASMKNFARDIPIIEWEIACLVARINGDDEPPKPRELEAALAELSLAA